jgi:hypothetical protein
MFIIRRRATVHEFVPVLVNLMVFGSVERIGSPNNKLEKNNEQLLIQEATHKYYVQGSGQQQQQQQEEELEKESQDEKWEQQDIRLKTGGPVFAMEEADVVRAARVSVLAELASVSKPSTLAPHCKLLLRLVIDALRLDPSRPVCRAASLLARELYGCLLREQDELAEAVDRNETATALLPLAVALISSSDEELLVSTLQNHASLNGSESDRRVTDPAASARCREALQLREQAGEAGILTAARVVITQGERLVSVPTVLTLLQQNHSGIIEIDKMKSYR